MRISKALLSFTAISKRYDFRNESVLWTLRMSYSSLLNARILAKTFNDSLSSNYKSVNDYHDVPSDKLTPVSINEVKNILKSHKIEFTEGFSCLIIKCPICTNMKKIDLFINKVTGHIVCRGCKRSGDWNKLHTALLNKAAASESEAETSEHSPELEQSFTKYDNSAGEKWKALVKSSEQVYSMSADARREVMQYFTSKEIPDDVMKQLDMYINYSEDGNRTYLVPLKQSTSDVVGFIQILPDESELVEPCRNCRGIITYKTKPIRKDASAVIVHSIKDFLALARLQLNYHIICLPHGITSLPQDILPLLERYKKIILWFGNDSACWDAARQFAKKLNMERCFFVRPTDENPPPHVLLLDDSNVENYDAKKIIDKAEPIIHPSIISFSDIRQDILSSLHNIDKAQGVRWQRFPGLNSLLRGHRRGELTILTGPTGSGKTTFMSEYSLDLLMQGVSTLWGSFEIKNQRLACTMLQQYVQLPLGENTDKYNLWADSFERLPLYFMTFHGQQPLKVVLEAVEHSAYVYDIAHVIIDNVQFMLGMLENENSHLDRFYRQDALIAAFRNFATRHNCHVTLVIHPRKERDAEPLTVSSIFGGAKASQEADNVLIVQQKMLQSLKLKKYLQVAKNRYSGDLGIISLDFDKTTLSFSNKLQDGRSFNKELKTVNDVTDFDKTQSFVLGNLHSCQ